ncbi:integral membrane protein [Grosmannia clavigera kw1407]|uniref:Integral membrane protein n=1 Tax=Grosmannia clavigera (strain kw1407 / UAMH 11150) TaxID=655863 RepID=F0X9A2_GROCL|nr:uncharacterized protein CMQ_3573 [Grosmannia clavigera kw1407]EFX05504.1 integral membrane protein [Grosmannia clavigera kw1407]
MNEKHSLQRLESPSRTFSYLFHLAGVCSFMSSLVYIFLFPQIPAGSFGGDFQYLTILGLALSFLTFMVAYAADISLLPEVFATKNKLAVCVAPLEVLISILYWGLRAYDKNLVFPPDLEVELPLLADIGFHAAPAAFLALDLLLFSPPWTISPRDALELSLVLALTYWSWVEICFSYNHFYPYPIFELLNKPQRMGLFGFSALLMTGSTVMLKALYRWLNGVDAEPVKKD